MQEKPINNSDQPDNGSPNTNIKMPPLDLTTKVPQNPLNLQTRTITLQDIEISYNDNIYSHQIFSLGADLYFILRNNGETTQTVYIDEAEEIAQTGSIPEWNRHFFGFQANTITLQPGQEEIVHYFASMDDNGEFEIEFDFWTQQDKSDTIPATVTFYCENQMIDFPQSARIYGTIYDKKTHNPIEGAEIVCYYYNGRENAFREQTDQTGFYCLPVTGVDDFQSYFGDQKLAYESLNHFLSVEYKDYKYYYQEIEIKRGEEKQIDIYLEPTNPKTYELQWEDAVSDYFGFFWLNVDSDWKNVLAVQAKHPPELNKNTHAYFYNITTGEQKWSFEVGDECWGSDITEDGSLATLGSHDQYIYVIDALNGTLKWKKDSGNTNREVEFSADDQYILTGPVQQETSSYDFALYNSTTGEIQNTFGGYDKWLRNSRFNREGTRFVVGLSAGYLCMYDVQTAEKIWQNYIGEFPLFLEIDQQDNVYATGKGRTLFSYSPNGTLRWSYRIPDHTITSGAISDDGQYIIIGSVGAWIYYIDTDNGELLWRTRLSVEGESNQDQITSVGHNAVSISADGEYIAVGGGPANQLTVYDSQGTKLFEHTSTQNDDFLLNDKFATIGEGASDSTQQGIMCTKISEHGEKIIAAYGDNYIRCFVKQ